MEVITVYKHSVNAASKLVNNSTEVLPSICRSASAVNYVGTQTLEIWGAKTSSPEPGISHKAFALSVNAVYSLGRILNIRLPSVRESPSKGILLLTVSHVGI